MSLLSVLSLCTQNQSARTQRSDSVRADDFNSKYPRGEGFFARRQSRSTFLIIREMWPHHWNDIEEMSTREEEWPPTLS
jgi:hypothetical protein